MRGVHEVKVVFRIGQESQAAVFKVENLQQAFQALWQAQSSQGYFLGPANIVSAAFRVADEWQEYATGHFSQQRVSFFHDCPYLTYRPPRSEELESGVLFLLCPRCNRSLGDYVLARLSADQITLTWKVVGPLDLWCPYCEEGKLSLGARERFNEELLRRLNLASAVYAEVFGFSRQEIRDTFVSFHNAVMMALGLLGDAYPKRLEALVAVLLEGRTLDEAARSAGVARATIHDRVRRGRRWLWRYASDLKSYNLSGLLKFYAKVLGQLKKCEASLEDLQQEKTAMWAAAREREEEFWREIAAFREELNVALAALARVGGLKLEDLDKVRGIRLEDLRGHLSVRTFNTLAKGWEPEVPLLAILTRTRKEIIASVRSFGSKCADELERVLKEQFGVRLREG